MSKKRKNRKKKREKEQKEQKNQEETNWTKEILSYALIILFAILLSQHLNVVVSGSMETAFYRGDIVATETSNLFGLGVQEFNPQTDVNVGDVVVYDAVWYSEPVIHRVINVETINGTKYFTIKGDNNKEPDPYLVPPDRITAKVLTIGDNLVVIPKIGYITLWFRGL